MGAASAQMCRPCMTMTLAMQKQDDTQPG